MGVKPTLFSRSEPETGWVVVGASGVGARRTKQDTVSASQRLLPIRYRRSPPHPPRPTPRFGETNSPAFFLIRTFPTQCLSLSPCREQTSWSPSLNPSALSPPHSFTRESRAPEARRGGRAQDVRGPGSGAGKGLGAGWGVARILDSSGGREAWISREIRLLRPSCLPGPYTQ